MPTPYFDVTNSSDLALLPPPFRTHRYLADAAAVAESDVIARYTDDKVGIMKLTQFSLGSVITLALKVGPYTFVCLRGLGTSLDASDPQADPTLLLALKNTIAELIPWTIRNWERDPVISSEGGQGNTRSYRVDALRRYPVGLWRRLSPYDLRGPTWSI